MRKIFTIIGTSIISLMNAQVGVNTSNPQATLDIRKSPTIPVTIAQGVSFPNFTSEERATFTNVKKGTMIYNTTKHCLEVYGIQNDTLDWYCVCDNCSAGSENVKDGASFAILYDAFILVRNDIFVYKDAGQCSVGGYLNSGLEFGIEYKGISLGKYEEQRYSLTRTSNYEGDGHFEGISMTDTNTITLVIPAGEITEMEGTIPAYLEVDGDGKFALYNGKYNKIKGDGSFRFENIRIGNKEATVVVKVSDIEICSYE